MLVTQQSEKRRLGDLRGRYLAQNAKSSKSTGKSSRKQSKLKRFSPPLRVMVTLIEDFSS
jgi:hypothetical protein